MKYRSAALACALLIAPTAALADPVGTYDVVGINPDTGGQYTGTVEVKRLGSTYDVTWTIANATSTGTGIGGRLEGGRLVAGPAGSSDMSLSVGYQSGDSVGIANYYLQPNGSWQGVWTYAGSGKVAAETWTPR